MNTAINSDFKDVFPAGQVQQEETAVRGGRRFVADTYKIPPKSVWAALIFVHVLFQPFQASLMV